MMKKVKRLVVFLVSLCTLFCVAGCNSGGAHNSSTEGNNSSGTGGGDSDSGNIEIPAPTKEYDVFAFYFPNFGSQYQDKAYSPLTDCEWGTVSRAIPRFDGHIIQQPLWGYENHSDPEVMEKVIDAALEYGVDGFFVDWYWYKEARTSGKGLNGSADGLYLGAEFERGFLKAKNNTEMKFVINWCNHDANNWKSDFGQDANEFDVMTTYVVENYMTLPNYAKADNGKLYFMIYDLSNFVGIFKNTYGQTDIRLAKAALENFNKKAKAKGLGGIEFITFSDNRLNAVDATAAWPGGIPPVDWDTMEYMGIKYATKYNISVDEEGKRYDIEPNGAVRDYKYYPSNANVFWKQNIDDAKENGNYQFVPVLSAGYDATVRISPFADWNPTGSYPHGAFLWNVKPEYFRQAAFNARKALDAANQNMLLISAWNEWGEGSMMEPTQEYGYGYLRAIKEVFGSAK